MCVYVFVCVRIRTCVHVCALSAYTVSLSPYKCISVNVCVGTHTPLHLYPPGVSVMAMAVSVCWTSRGLWCVTASITLSGWTARGVTHSTRTGLGPGPPATLPTSVWVSIGDWFSLVTTGEMYSWGSVWVSIGDWFNSVTPGEMYSWVSVWVSIAGKFL